MDKLKALKDIYDKVDRSATLVCRMTGEDCEQCEFDSRMGCYFDGIKEDIEKMIINEAIIYGTRDRE